MTKIRVAINADVTPGVSGGVFQATQGLISSLGQLDGPEEYLLLANTHEEGDWIGACIGPNQQVRVKYPRVRANRRFLGSSSGDRSVRAALRPSVEAIRQLFGKLTPQHPTLPLSDGYFESLNCDVLHFPTQWFAVSALPTIYNPHDLQHLHYPQFWTPWELARRELVYRAACHFARTVIVGSQWIKQDVVHQYAVHPEKVQVVPWAPPTVHYAPISEAQQQEARRRLNLPDSYALYPAVTWPHKNHLRLLDALALLRDRRGLKVNLICTGARSEEHWPRVEGRVRELGLHSQVTFLGFLAETDLRAVYRSAQFLVLPSLFEADSCPIHEAWSERIPVASSNHTALPEQVANAGLLFDAGDVVAIADAVQLMSCDADLRARLAELGHQRVKDFDWTLTAKAYRAVYRRTAGVKLGDEDRWLLQWDWMGEPERKPRSVDLHQTRRNRRELLVSEPIQGTGQ